MRKRKNPPYMRWAFSLVSDAAFGLVAAAAEYHDQGKDDDPGAVVVKDMTKLKQGDFLLCKIQHLSGIFYIRKANCRCPLLTRC